MHHGSPIKAYLHTTVVINAVTVLPASFVFLIYETGVLCLQWQVQMFGWAVAIFIFDVILMLILATFAE